MMETLTNSVNENSTSNEKRSHRCGRSIVTLKTTVQLFSTVLIPIILAVSATVLSIQQQNIAHANRKKDIEMEDKRREQDAFLAAKQRDKDREIANETRLQDQLLDEQRRAQDRIQAESVLKQEADIDEKRRQQQLVIADSIQKDLVLSTYIRDIADLLVLNNFSLNHELLISVVRPKTLITLRQLDVNRKAFLFSFLYDSRLLVRNDVDLSEYNREPISLQGATLDCLDMSINVPSTDRRARLRYASLADASLTNSSFINRDLYGADFSYVYADNADFTRADIAYTRFYQASLRQANFYFVSMPGVDFTKADLTGAKNIDEESLLRAKSLVSAILPNGTRQRGNNLLNNPGGESTLDSDCDDGGLPNGWNTRLGRVSTLRSSISGRSNRCYFIGVGNDDISSIYQIVHLADARYWIAQNHGEFYIGARLSPNSFVNVTQGKLRHATIAGPADVQGKYKENSFYLQRDTKELLVELIFKRSLTAKTNLTYGFADDIDLWLHHR